ncbi:hypothetical protein BDV95DRAFT_561303 [Massariosphaeria phaeospora]|uniref:Uncharacterized protein n=1 Tax=Massariosphaeria phaeospora TaxID=100035 RepID=A0A7C8MWJ0_9PLEO|nr:hypothetical protein BDV95DRAFT_561303 [Massariosphaeria phaeospora]
MRSVRSWPRLSDSDVDLEESAAIKELEELKVAGSTTGTPSPNAPHMVTLEVDIGLSSIGPHATTSSHTSRSNYQPKRQTDLEKVIVFKDDSITQHPNIPREHSRPQDDPPYLPTVKLVAIGLHSRSKSDPSVSRLLPKNTPQPPRIPALAASVGGTRSEFIRQLQSIEVERAKLIGELNALSVRKTTILRQLVEEEWPTSAQQHVTNNKQDENISDPLSERLAVLRIPVQDTNSTQAPKKLPSAAISATLHIRPLTAPPRLAPSNPRHRATIATKRVPLGDKTEMPPGTLATTSFAPAVSEGPPTEHPSEIETVPKTPFKAGSCTPFTNGRSTQVPVKFGDRKDARLTSGSDHVRPAAPARQGTAPEIMEHYDIPTTVARKKWKF